MTREARALLKAFDGLSADDRRQVAAQILRRSMKFATPPLTDAELIQIADRVFFQLDREELEDAKS